MKTTFLCIAVAFTTMLFAPASSPAQQYKLKQVTTTDYAKIENTIYVKGMRQRIETGAVMGMTSNLVTILQCDLKRTVTLDTVKKLYFIEPFNSRSADKTAAPAKEPTSVKEDKKVKKGGTITMWINLHDTGERKKMYGFTARHIWSDQKIKPSPDACSMKDSMLMYTDGWYIDLPEFNCPRQYEGFTGGYSADADCHDKMIVHEKGKAKMGFPITQTTTIIMGGQKMVTKIETLELSTARLDSLLFGIPKGYKAVENKEALYAGMNVGAVMENAIKNEDGAPQGKAVKETKVPGTIRIGVYAPTGNDDIQASAVQQHVINNISVADVDAIAVASEEEARRYNCDYTLTITYSNIRSATKAANVLKAIRKTDPDALNTYAVQGSLQLTSLKDGTIRKDQAMDGKYDGKINEAAGKAVDEQWNAMKQLLKM